MNSQEALKLTILEYEKDLEEDENNQWVKNVLKGLKECQKDLERLEKLGKAIEIILKYKIRPSAFAFTIKNYREVSGEDLTFEISYILLDFCGTQEEYELLKEVLANE